MAHPALADARAHLTGLRGVTVFDWPDPREPDCRAFVIAGIRCCEIRASHGGIARAAHHLRDGEWLGLAEHVTVNGAFAAVAARVERTAHLPGWYSPATDALVRAPAADVLAGAPALPSAA